MRSTCARCLRPTPFCVCAGLVPAPSRTRVVLLQHPREARLAICSAWLTRIALENVELHRGVRFDDHPRVRELLAGPGTALLYPGPGSIPAGEASPTPRTLVVLDATWLQADRMLRDNPGLAALPRIGLVHRQESGYTGLRREPAEGHLSTIEAVALALGALEREPARFAPMAEAFRRAVRLQLEATRTRRNPRHRSGRGAPPRAAPPACPPGRRGSGSASSRRQGRPASSTARAGPASSGGACAPLGGRDRVARRGVHLRRGWVIPLAPTEPTCPSAPKT